VPETEKTVEEETVEDETVEEETVEDETVEELRKLSTTRHSVSARESAKKSQRKTSSNSRPFRV
jgi:hypothetical protein